MWDTELGDLPLYSRKYASMLYPKGAISSSLKVLAANPTLRNGQASSCQGHAFLAHQARPVAAWRTVSTNAPAPQLLMNFYTSMPFCQPLINLTGAGTIFIQFFSYSI